MRQWVQRFLQLESSSSIILLLAAIIAMIWANSPLVELHDRFIAASLFWINEGFMALFFLLVGLELKRGFMQGELSKVSQAMLPAVAAFGGMLVPALIYWAINHDHPIAAKGWATPVATDIAFAVGVLTLFGRRVPYGLKLFLLALAIFDDIGAIIIIALFYSHGIAYLWLFQSLVLVLILYLFNRLNIRKVIPYLIVGVCLWFALLKSGVHPTISGVLLALTIPTDGSKSAFNQLENKLHPWVAYLIMPMFALANAGFSLHDLSWDSLREDVVLGIVLGLFVGKQVGVFGFSWLLIRLRFAKLPTHTSWLSLYGVALLCGIGFTMSLFLGTLSFQNEAGYLAEVRLSVIIGSILSGLVGAYVLLIGFARDENKA